MAYLLWMTISIIQNSTISCWSNFNKKWMYTPSLKMNVYSYVDCHAKAWI